MNAHFSWRRLGHVVLWLGVAAIVWLAIRQRPDQTQPAPVAPADEIARKPLIETLPPVPDGAASRVIYVIAFHPEPAIREEFAGMVSRREAVVLPMHDAPAGVGSSFRALSQVEIDNGEPYSVVEGSGELIPAIIVNMRWVSAMRTKEDALDLMGVVYHEWFHLKDYLAARERGDPVGLGLHRMNIKLYEDYDYSPRECELLWTGEVNAWRRSCLFANDVGIVGRHMLYVLVCPYAEDETAFAQAFWNAHGLLFPGSEECLAINAQLAGHPDPDSQLPFCADP